MPYDLGVQGFVGFARFGRVLSQTPIARDPLSGVVDGENRTFFANYYPLLTSGSLAVWVDSVSVPGSCNYDTGEVTLVTPPLSQPKASYTTTPFTSAQILNFLVGGFQTLEGEWWSRGWQLHDALGAMADESSANLYIVDRDGIDPVIGSTVFSGNWTQIALYQACVRLYYLRLTLEHKASVAYMWRETVRGMTVDQTKMPANIALAIKSAEAEVERMLAQAQSQVYPDGGHYGGFIADARSLDYVTNFEWQTSAKDNDNWEGWGYHNPIRRF